MTPFVPRFHALACDYDGTLARDGWINNKTVTALKRYKESGGRLVMVTGRELSELLSICPHVHLFERVVVENGAILYRPEDGTHLHLAESPSKNFVQLLRQKNINLSVGRVIVATWKEHEFTVHKVIRTNGFPLHVICNKDAVMVLPEGVNKATGLHSALREMGLRADEIAGVGDAENDIPFVTLCGKSVAVANALECLRLQVDLVTNASHGEGVAELIDILLQNAPSVTSTSEHSIGVKHVNV